MMISKNFNTAQDVAAQAKKAVTSSSDFVRLLVCAIVIDQFESDAQTSAKIPKRGCAHVQSHRFVLPVDKTSKIQEICQRIEGRMQMKVPASSLKCEGVYTSGLASQADEDASIEGRSAEEVNLWFSQLYSIPTEQSVSECFRDFDRITVKL